MLLPDGASVDQARALLLRRPETGFPSTDALWNQLSLGGAGTPAMDADGRSRREDRLVRAHRRRRV
ncbi:type II secretion system protein GspK [Sphingomonas sp. MMS24-JH45]